MVDEAALLSVRDVSLSFGRNRVLTDVSFDVAPGSIFAIIGPNGAGKTSLLNCISGFYRPQAGQIFLDGTDLTQTRTTAISRLGVARTFQNTALYTLMSTVDNLLAGRHIHMEQNLLQSMLFFGRARREEIAHRAVVDEVIDFLELGPIRDATVAALPYGLRKRIELGRALALEPRLLLLDEPMSGMTSAEKQEMVRFVREVNRRRGITVVLIEHDMGVVMEISDRIVVIDFGHKIGEGTPAEVRADPAVIQAYLGEPT